jgi:cellulose synthase/poly-beta-1,6-N-acetylglucosamine synthase-like glycosyltransferase
MSLAASIFWASLALLLYTFVGYPLVMAAWARGWPRPWRRAQLPAVGEATSDVAQSWPSVAMVVVMHNEAARVLAKLDTCLAQEYPAERLRVLLVSDGSTDETVALARARAHPRVEVLAFDQRRGKAACLNDAVAACDEQVIVFTDARQALNRQAVRCLVESLADPAVDVVSGELVFADAAAGFGQGVDAYWRYEKYIRRHEAMVHSVPGATGALYALRRSAWQAIPPQTILDDVLVPMQACLRGGRVVFDGRAQAFDQPAADVTTERRRKVRTLAGNFQLLQLCPALLAPWRNPIFIQFVSHKLLRLLAPWAMLAMLAASAWLAPVSAFHRLSLTAQTAFYLLPLLALAWPRLRAWRLVRVVQAFVALNAFAVLGLLEFLTNRRAHLWASAQASAQRRP